jgi:ADP-heptose:LPS heptosyltransferase
MGAKEFHDPRTYKPSSDLNLREWAAIIEAADYFIGCDSCGQHMRKCFNKKASVMIAGTHRINTTYKDFHIIERDILFCPDSMRVSGFHSHMVSRLNEKRIQFTSEEIENAYQEIISRIEGDNKSKAIANQPKEIKGVSYS